MSLSLRKRGLLIPWRIYIIPIELLKPHEEVCRDYLLKLYDEIVGDKVLKKPLLVEDRYYIVLDGHHRYAVLKMLGARVAPVFLVDYSSSLVEVYSWREDWNVTKEMVINAGLTESKLPYKTSRHILRDLVIPEVNIPLEKLMEEP
ncbi:MAG: transcriptional regulator [Thaumarchaeota archaeon]|nr:transcriptional regulator [Candidatus Geocrenenecus arthurdayi]MCL7390240.1 transcriptional regulator [Candidatus Geocrenenecus arthurdayi]MCL7391986.1 transcriptional regulator [Candidatus Geocrenenecus arthurdayi]MCL7397383.1 transcriptional regulator [Candidatus Geocrenenecus arthurdayi]MCL7401933.1 transcriptional regulator [Candidatus Geocrenenecus arthurdayi]